MKNMTPFKPATGEQIGKLADIVTARLKKYSNQFSSIHFQEILSDYKLIDEIHASVCRRILRIEARTGMIVRIVKVYRTRSNREALNATRRHQYLNLSVVDNAPQAKDKEAEVVLFKLAPHITSCSCSDLDKEYNLRGLSPADLQTICALNEQDPSFADEYPNCTQWKNKEGNDCYASFRCVDGKRGAGIDENTFGWSDDWWFVGLRK